MLKRINQMWNEGVERGFTVFQWFLVVFMIVGAIQNNTALFFVSFFGCIIGFFEPVKKDDALVSEEEQDG